jgi:Fur family ferric uptake transcriptional regulator
MRATPQRRLVLDALADLGHATPDQVGERVESVAVPLSPSTVYRTLELLEDLGVVSHTHIGHGAPTYHLTSHGDHVHLVCRRCGRVQEAAVDSMRALGDEVTGRYGFLPELGHLSLDGVCASCRGKSDAS